MDTDTNADIVHKLQLLQKLALENKNKIVSKNS